MKQSQLLLFDTSLCPRPDPIAAAKLEQGIITRRLTRSNLWVAYLPPECLHGIPIEDAVAEWATRLEDSGHLAEGSTEAVAVRRLCRARGISLP